MPVSPRDRFQLPQVIQIVTRHGFHNFAEAARAAFRVRVWFREVFTRHRRDQLLVPVAHRGENGERRACVECRVRRCPRVLIERLDDVMRLGQRLPQPEREHHFAIRQVAQNLACRPLAGCEAAIHTRLPNPLH
jgi:hypothetical protein